MCSQNEVMTSRSQTVLIDSSYNSSLRLGVVVCSQNEVTKSRSQTVSIDSNYNSSLRLGVVVCRNNRETQTKGAKHCLIIVTKLELRNEDLNNDDRKMYLNKMINYKYADYMVIKLELCNHN